MKFLTKFLVLLSVFHTVANAQIVSDYGIKIGIVSSKFIMDYSENSTNSTSVYKENRLGPTMGIFVKYLDANYFDFETELAYVQKGGTDKFEVVSSDNPLGTGESVSLDIQFDYIQFRTSLRPKYSINNLEIYGLFGISVDYLLSAKNWVLPRDMYKDFVWGYTVGLGFNAGSLLDRKISLEFIYNSDINEVYKGEDVQYTNRLFSVKMGFSLRNEN